MATVNRWKVEIRVTGSTKVVKGFRNQTGRQLRKLRNEWSQNKATEYKNTDFWYEAEADLKRIK